MTHRWAVELSDEELDVICEALIFFSKDGPTDDVESAVDWAAFNRSARIAEELGRRLPSEVAQRSLAA